MQYIKSSYIEYCKLEEGLPYGYNTFRGKVSDGKTMEEILKDSNKRNESISNRIDKGIHTFTIEDNMYIKIVRKNIYTERKTTIFQPVFLWKQYFKETGRIKYNIYSKIVALSE